MQNSIREKANGDSDGDGCGGGKRLHWEPHVSEMLLADLASQRPKEIKSDTVSIK